MIKQFKSNLHLTNSPHYFYRKLMGTTNENLNFDITVLTLSLPECLIEVCKVTLTFEFVNEIL